MLYQEESQEHYLTPQKNPQQLYEPIFYKNRFNDIDKHIEKRSSKLFQVGTSKNKNHNISKDEAFRKTSSCFSNTEKYHFVGDLCDNSTYDIRKVRADPARKIKESKSVENKVVLVSQQEQSLFKKMTIHCVRAEREAYQKNCQQLERQYNYIMNKMNKERKAKFFSELKDKKLQKLKQERRKFSEEIQKERKISLQKELNHHESSKNAVIIQRANTKYSIQKKKRYNMQSASRQRLTQQEIHFQLENSMLEELRKKKQLYLQEKQAQEERKHKIAKSKQVRRIEAKKQFRNRWLNQLERSNVAKLKYKQKKEKMENNLKKALQNFFSNQRRVKA